MELLVNSLIANVLLMFELIRGVLEWGDKALLIGAAVAAGAFFGTRAALTSPGRPAAFFRGGARI